MFLNSSQLCYQIHVLLFSLLRILSEINLITLISINHHDKQYLFGGNCTRASNFIFLQFTSKADELRGSMYMRVFGNELSYMNFQGLDSLLAGPNFNILDMMIQLAKDNDYTYRFVVVYTITRIFSPCLVKDFIYVCMVKCYNMCLNTAMLHI